MSSSGRTSVLIMRNRPRATTGSADCPSITSATSAPKRRADGVGLLRHAVAVAHGVHHHRRPEPGLHLAGGERLVGGGPFGRVVAVGRVGLGQQGGLDEGERAAAPVHRVRAGVRIADRVDPGHQRGAVRCGEVPQAVDQPAHRAHRSERHHGPGVDEAVRSRQHLAGPVEGRRGPSGAAAQLAVARAHGQRHRERRAVARHGEVLEVAEVAPESRVDVESACRAACDTSASGRRCGCRSPPR